MISQRKPLILIAALACFLTTQAASPADARRIVEELGLTEVATTLDDVDIDHCMSGSNIERTAAELREQALLSCLKYVGRNRTTRNIVMGAAAVQIVLLIVLVPPFAATGAAIAYAVSMSGMYLVFSRIAHRELVVLRASGEV